MQSTATAELFFSDSRIGLIRNVFCSDDTWYGDFELDCVGTDRVVLNQVAPFIEFCADWNKRESLGQADVEEFDVYQCVIQPGKWMVIHSDGAKHRITDAPVFFPGGEISWRIS